MYKDKEQKRIKELERANIKRQILNQYKVDKGCIDCGYNAHHAALEFDHIGDDKVKNVAAMMWSSWTEIWKEAAKCEIVCSNCHSIRTWQRKQLNG